MSPETVAVALFVLNALVIAAGGLLAVLSNNLVRALMGLILTLLGVAGMYMLMNATFMALMQILIYVGAVAVLIFFAIMLTRGKDDKDFKPGEINKNTGFALAGGLLPAAVIFYAALFGEPPTTPVPQEVPLEQLGSSLMNEYLLAFELISVVLFAAMAGAVLLGFERRGGK